MARKPATALDPYLVLFACVFTGGKEPKKAIVRLDAANKHMAAKAVRDLAEHPMLLAVKVVKTKCIGNDPGLLRDTETHQTLADFRVKLNEAYAAVRERLIEEGSLKEEDAPTVEPLNG